MNKEKVDTTKMTKEILFDDIFEKVLLKYEEKEKEVGSETMREVERNVLLQVVDTKWREHLYEMDHLKEGIGLRAYAGKDPLIEYKKEGFHLFESMIGRTHDEVAEFLFKIQIVDNSKLSRKHFSAETTELKPTVSMSAAIAPRAPMAEKEMYANSPDGPPKIETIRREEPKVGRNDACPCGSGKKYKKCHGKDK